MRKFTLYAFDVEYSLHPKSVKIFGEDNMTLTISLEYCRT